MHKFDYGFLKNGLLPANFVSLSAAIGAFHAISDLRRDSNQAVYSQMAEIARALSVKTSNEIEGIVTTDERFQAIMTGNTAPLSHSEQEIAGYRDVLDEIHTGYRNMSLDEDLILHMHEVLYRYTDDTVGGKYKTENNLIMARDMQGRVSVRFRPVSAAETAEAMEQLVLAYTAARDESGLNQLLLIPCVILDFLCIHPFADGNGRMSRLLTLLLLYKNGYDVGKYVSFEQQIQNDKGSYYDALYESSKGWHESENTYFSFMENFLVTLYRCYKELDSRFSSENGKVIPKHERVEQTVLNSILPISKYDVCAALPDVSPSTVEAVIGKMVKEGRVKKVGSTRNAKYLNVRFAKGSK